MSEDIERSTGSECPACGVTVSAGYPKCPKCHTAMPNAPGKRPAYARDAPVSGGTALESSSAMAWVAGLVALLLIGGGTVYFMTGGGKAKHKAAATARSTGAVAPKAFVPQQPRPGNPPEIGGDADAAPTAHSTVRPVSAVGALRDALSAESLWSEVEFATGDDTSVVVRTTYCADPRLRAVVGKLTPTLKAAKVEKLRCETRHGSLVFALEL